MGTMIKFDCVDGRPASGYLAAGGGEKAPGIVVVQEWWGLQNQIKGICDRLATVGYRALAPDLFGGKTVPYHDAEAAGHEMNSLDFLDATDNVLCGAAMHFAKSGSKVGLTGFCMGGALTVLGSIRVPQLDAAVCFYGVPQSEAANPADISIPLQAHFANDDDWCTPAVVDVFEEAAKEAKAPVEIFRYKATHGFMNEQRADAYNRECAELAWRRSLDFWSLYL